MSELEVFRLSPSAILPAKAHPDDVGYDLSVIDIKKTSGNVLFCGTGLAVRPPHGYYVEIVPRSSMSKTSFVMPNSFGVIDPNYRGELLIPLRVVDKTYSIEFPFKIAQLVIRKQHSLEIVEVDSLDETDRGTGGFGSTN